MSGRAGREEDRETEADGGDSSLSAWSYSAYITSRLIINEENGTECERGCECASVCVCVHGV